jgi:hypothetical protein
MACPIDLNAVFAYPRAESGRLLRLAASAQPSPLVLRMVQDDAMRNRRDRSGGGFPSAGYEPHPSCGDSARRLRAGFALSIKIGCGFEQPWIVSCLAGGAEPAKKSGKISRKIVVGQQ